MKILHIDSSVLGIQSVSRVLSAAIVSRLKENHPDSEVLYRDLDANPLPHLTAVSLSGDRDEVLVAQDVMNEFLSADILVIGAPMYNFSIPSTLKAWIDRIAVAGKTFRYTENGSEGLVKEKSVIVASSRGGVHQKATDFQELYLRQVFGFMGVNKIEFIRAEGIALSLEHRLKAIDVALDKINTLNCETV